MNNANRLTLWLVFAGSCAIGLLACSADSLWIDEAWMALLASEPTPEGWWRAMWEASGSTLQMPFYSVYLWLWEKMAGHSEWALRAANIPFFILGQWALFRSLRHQKRVAVFTVLVAGVSPFLWGYLAEARPYAMQYGGACLAVAGLIQLSARRPLKTRDLMLFCAGLILLCGSSALAFPWAGMAALTALWLNYKDPSLMRVRALHAVLLTGVGLLLLAIFIYDLWAARNGAKPSSVGKTSSLNLLFVGYELLGFLGLGPGRLEIRESQSLSVLMPYLGSLSLLVAALALALFHVRRVEKSLWMSFLLYSVAPLIFVTLLALIAPFRLLGRHITPLAPVLFVILGFAAAAPAKWRGNHWFVAVWLASALILRTHSRHHRDDYRDAASAAKTALAKNENVWWSADRSAAAYYGVPLGPGVFGGAKLVTGVPRAGLAEMLAPDLVITSKPDIYDPADNLESFLREHSFTPIQALPAFKIWRQAAAPADPREFAETARR